MPSRPDGPPPSPGAGSGPDPGPGPGPAPGAGTGAEERTTHRWWALTVIGLAQLMVVLDATIVNIALPSMQRDLGFANDGRQWIITAYTLAFGSLLLLGGRLADLIGRRRTFVTGLIGFGAASALGGTAGSFSALVGARALQGMFGAVLAPSALSLLTTTFTQPRERSRAFGIFGAIAGSGGAIGLLLGGVLTEHLTWRWTLYVNVVIALAGVIGAMAILPPHRPSGRTRLDLPGTALVAGGLFCLVYGFSSADTESWGDWRCWAALTLSAVLLACFVVHESRTDNPLLPPRVVRNRNRAASFISVFIAGAGMFGVFLFVTYYLQRTLGYTPVRTGLAFLPMVVALMITAQLSTNVLIPRIGPKPVVPAGMGLAAAGLVWLTALSIHSEYTAHVLPPLVVMGVGLGLVMPSAISLATLGVVKRDQGVASATVNTMQQVGGSVGTSLFNTLAAAAVTDYTRTHPRTPDLVARANVHSFAVAYWTAAGFFAAGLIVTALLYQRGRPRDLAVGRTTGETAEAGTGTGAGTGA
ncbi:MFS transporter [Streptomyces sp. HNM0575]|uniref:MFS transporter n=1 Tax=Streptomyces sp. HNM0575 TaxID=2716338 RepID=UPI00145EC912|nr:MFS transporter [Streptomyces sp. HNM0575]NLU73471.1 MFS transporter [Streptomyces sp. HNM0575]